MDRVPREERMRRSTSQCVTAAVMIAATLCLPGCWMTAGVIDLATAPAPDVPENYEISAAAVLDDKIFIDLTALPSPSDEPSTVSHVILRVRLDDLRYDKS